MIIKAKKIGSGEYSVTGRIKEYAISKHDYERESWTITYGNFGDSDYWRDPFSTKKECLEIIRQVEARVQCGGSGGGKT
jgi:hypothetical protein